jgi:hypothetical protein
LQSSGEAAVVGGIIQEITVNDRDFGTSIDGCVGSIAICHGSTIKNVEGILALREKYTRRGSRDRDP